ncbi:MAG: porin family protein [Beijerinckiaceae bacterium]|nr:MAG: porin family protein [Beijerinckiaceae bacterium]
MARSSGTMQAIILAGALAAGTIGTAAAADLPALPPPPPLETPAPIQFNGWYLRGDVGAGLNWMQNFTSSDAYSVPGFAYNGSGLGTQAIIGAGVGYQFNNWFRADITGEYRTGSKFWAKETYFNPVSGLNGGDGYSGSVRSAVVLANGYFDLGTWYGFTPFVGGGVGVAFNQFHGLTDIGLGPDNFGAYGSASDKSSAQFAWALMAGIDYSITPNWKVELSYRYLDMGKVSSNRIACTAGCTGEVQSFRMASNDIRVGVRYLFGEVPISPPLPVVSKY